MIKEKPVRTERVIQFGEGGFLRGFVDWILQAVNDSTDFDGSVVVVQPIDKGMCDVLTAQDCVYTHIIRGAEGVDKKIIDVISRCVKPYEDYESFLKLAENKDFRFVVSNTTESGISYEAGCKLTDAPPKTFPAKVTALLKRRFDLGLPGFVFLPCELIDKNGTTLKQIILTYADEWNLGEDFKAFVENDNTFCNTLVDRINTGYPKGEKLNLGYADNMVNTSEYFHLWVIEGPKDKVLEIPFDKTSLNIIITDDLSRYRTRKVRILNGAHTAMIPYAMLSGIETVKDCMDDETMSSFDKSCVFDEIIPTLDLPKEELISYANSVFERFNNPYIKHYCSSISLNSVSKFKVRVLPSILEYIKRYNKMPEKLLFSFARLIEFYKTDMPNDDPAVMEFMKKATTKEILKNEQLWGQDLSFLEKEIAKYE
ncbi:MAG: tagaturonate reductase [Bacillota bacterium]|nr:tagaturonate reductase [Bacillota bacterium]